jgi:RNA polymerase sigma factor (sigma-70 family)
MSKDEKNRLNDEDYRVRTEERCFYIDLEGNGGRIWVNETDYKNYRRIVEAEWQEKINASRCLIPAERGLYKRCRKDCSQCPLTRSGNHISYEAIIENTGNEMPDDFDMRAAYEYDEMRERLWAEVSTLDELNQRIMHLYNEEYTEREIAKKVGLSQKAVNLRIKKCIQLLKDKLRNF